MKWELALTAALALAVPAQANNRAKFDSTEHYMACVIGHAALILKEAGDVDKAMEKAYPYCKAPRESRGEGWDDATYHTIKPMLQKFQTGHSDYEPLHAR
jgi:hypothetical protein